MYDCANQMKNLLQADRQRTVHIAGLSYYPTPCVHPSRTLDEHVIFIITEGKWEITQGTTSYNLYEGDVMFLTANIHHYGTQLNTQGMRAVFIHFDAFPEDTFAVPDEQNNGLVIPPVVHCQNNPEVLTLFHRINSAFWSYDKRKVLLQSSYLSALLCELEKSASAETADDEKIILQINNLLIENPDKFFSVDELSKKFFISKRKLYYLFKNRMWATPHAYQISLKLSMCRQQLAAFPDVTLKNLASSYGFCDEFHLSKLYKQKYGTSPKR